MTPKQREALDAIKRLTVDGVSPTYDEIRIELGLASKGRVFTIVRDLAERGLITFMPDRWRSIRVVDGDPEAVPFHQMAEAVAHYVNGCVARGERGNLSDVRLAMMEAYQRSRDGASSRPLAGQSHSPGLTPKRSAA